MPVWDIERRPADEQFDYWREVVCQAFVPLTPRRTTVTSGFPGRVESNPLGTVNRARLRSVPQAVAHGPREVGRGDGGYYFVNLQLAGRCLVRTSAGESLVRPGELTVVDTAQPYWFTFGENWRMLSYRIAHPALRSRLPSAGHGIGVSIDGTAGFGGVLTALMRSTWDLPACPVPELEQSLVSVLALAMDALAEPAEGRTRDAVRAAVLRHVEAELGTPELSVTSVCRRFGFSPRYLHTLFAGTPETFAATVRGLRLDRCARLIAAPGRTETITSIAGRHGFADPASFSRAFRRRFGVAPRDVGYNQVAEGS